MTLREPTYVAPCNPTMICYDNLTHIPQLNLQEQSFIPRSPASLNTLQWLKYVIFPLININIWQKLINRSFTILIYQTMRVWTTINFQIHHTCTFVNTGQYRTACKFIWRGCTIQDFHNFPCQGTLNAKNLWLMMVIFHVKARR